MGLPMAGMFRSIVTAASIASLLGASLPPPRASAAELSRAAYDDCAARDEAGLAAALSAISADALKTGIGTVDYNALVANAWREQNLDDLIDTRVDLAVEEVKAETTWSERLKSIANTEASQKLATAVAERVYHAQAVKTALEAVAGSVAKDIGKAMEGATSEAAAPVLTCLKAFIGPRYGSAVAEAVAGDAGKDLAVDPSKGQGDPTAGAMLKQSGGGLAGATILIVRRQLAQIATRVGQRIVGSVLSRLVSVAAGGIGLVLIAKDIWDFRHGVLPIIASEMKSPATKQKVRDEVASSISQQIGDHIKEIADTSAQHVLEIWKEFKRAHAIVLKIAESDGAFRAFLDTVAPARLSRLDEVVGLVVASEGEPAVAQRLANGTLNTAVHTLPDPALQIARETRSLEDGLTWAAIAGDKIGTIVDYDIHKYAKPSAFTQTSLSKVLALGDRAAVVRLASVPAKARDLLFSLNTTDLSVLARNLSEAELTTLASYLDGLHEGPRERVLRAVAANPSRMQILAKTRVRDAIIASADQAAAVGMMLETAATFSARAFADDLQLAAEGKVNPILLWDKHPIGVGGLAALGALLLVWMMRLFRRPRTAAAPTTPAPTTAGAAPTPAAPTTPSSDRAKEPVA